MALTLRPPVAKECQGAAALMLFCGRNSGLEVRALRWGTSSAGFWATHPQLSDPRPNLHRGAVPGAGGRWADLEQACEAQARHLQAGCCPPGEEYDAGHEVREVAKS